jgi:hypothetical protein
MFSFIRRSTTQEPTITTNVLYDSTTLESSDDEKDPHVQPEEVEEPVREPETLTCLNEVTTSPPNERRPIYTVRVDKNMYGYKTNFYSALRLAKRIQKRLRQKIVNFDRVYEWQEWQPTINGYDNVVYHCTLVSWHMNFLMRIQRKEHEVVIERAAYVH